MEEICDEIRTPIEYKKMNVQDYYKLFCNS